MKDKLFYRTFILCIQCCHFIVTHRKYDLGSDHYFNVYPVNTIDKVCLAGLDIHNIKRHGVRLRMQQDVSNFDLCAHVSITFLITISKKKCGIESRADCVKACLPDAINRCCYVFDMVVYIYV